MLPQIMPLPWLLIFLLSLLSFFSLYLFLSMVSPSKTLKVSKSFFSFKKVNW